MSSLSARPIERLQDTAFDRSVLKKEKVRKKGDKKGGNIEKEKEEDLVKRSVLLMQRIQHLIQVVASNMSGTCELDQLVGDIAIVDLGF